MPILVTYKCDRCDHEQDSNDQMWHVAVGIWHDRNSAPILDQGGAKLRALWCRVCVEEVGLLGPYHPAEDKIWKAESPPEPTIEGIIRDIVAEMLQEQE